MNWTNRNMPGRIVIIHPDFNATGAERKGTTAKVKDFYPERSIATVVFKDGHKGVYMAANLLCLRKSREILSALRSSVFMNVADSLTMLQVYRLAHARQYRKALKLAMTNDITRYYCTASGQECFG